MRDRLCLVPLVITGTFIATVAAAAERVVQLDPFRDVIGQQVYAVQTYTPTTGGPSILDIGLYDTGASVISFSFFSNPYFPQPHLNPGGAGGQGVGGSVIGDVSQPGTILAGGLADFTFEFDTNSFDYTFGTLTDPVRAVPGIQAFVGTEAGSPSLPSLTGTPIHKPSQAFPGGSAALVTMQGLDFGTSFGLMAPLFIPQFDLVPAGSSLSVQAGSTAPVRVPLGRFGTDNYGAEGTSITSVSNPTLTNVTLRGSAVDETFATTVAPALLFDTGAQVSLISSAIAADLGLDLDAPETTLQVRGAAGTTITLPGFTIGGIDLAAAVADGDFTDVLAFRDVPVFVYDLGIPGLDGILGMNLFNGADELLIDLVNDRLAVTFFEDPELQPGNAGSLVGLLLGDQFTGFAGHVAPAFGLGPIQPVPEPTTLAALAAAAVVAAVRTLSRRRGRQAA
jgi:hypothetical protein